MDSFRNIDWGGMTIKVLSALAIIIVTAILAMLIKKGVEKLTERIPALNRPGVDGASVGRSLGSIASLIVWLLGLVAVLNVFQLDGVLSPVTSMLDKGLSFVPNIIGAVFVFVIGLMIAKVVRSLIETGLRAINVDRWLGKARSGFDKVGATDSAPARTAEPQVRPTHPAPGAAGHDAPVDAWATGTAEASGAHAAPQMGGAAGNGPQGQAQAHAQGNAPQAGGRSQAAQNLPGIIASVVFALIMIVVSISALQILGIAAISQPAQQMLTTLFNAIPNIIAAAILLAIGVVIARFASSLLEQVLEGVGLDRSLRRAGVLSATTSALPTISRIVEIAIVLFFAVMATQMLGFAPITRLLTQVLAVGGQVVFGAAIIAVGFFIAQLLASMISGRAAGIVKYATIVLFVAMGLKSMGVADSIIEMGFGALVIGAAAAAALAFGLGGRNVAARQLEKLEREIN